MKYKLFFANLPDDVTEDQLQVVCTEHGEVVYLSLLKDEEQETFTGQARVTLETEGPLEAILVSLNSQRFGDQRPAVSRVEPSSPWPDTTDDQRAVVSQIVDTLGEEASLAQRQIKRIVVQCGAAFAQGLLTDTLQIEEQGGIWLEKYQRRRTPGGVYLYLARQKMSPQMVKTIFKSKKNKTKSKQQVQDTVPAPTSETSPAGVGETEPRAVGESSNPIKGPVAQDVPSPVGAADDLAVVREQLAALQRAHQEAQEKLAAVKAGNAGPGVSAMAIMKAVVDTQRVLSDFIQQHPELA
jgi:RNA recognition motif-containing protein